MTPPQICDIQTLSSMCASNQKAVYIKNIS